MTELTLLAGGTARELPRKWFLRPEGDDMAKSTTIITTSIGTTMLVTLFIMSGWRCEL